MDKYIEKNKAYELRLKALDYTRTLNEQSTQNSRRNFNYTSSKPPETIYPTAHKYRKNNQQNYYLKHQ